MLHTLVVVLGLRRFGNFHGLELRLDVAAAVEKAQADTQTAS